MVLIANTSVLFNVNIKAVKSMHALLEVLLIDLFLLPTTEDNRLIK